MLAPYPLPQRRSCHLAFAAVLVLACGCKSASDDAPPGPVVLPSPPVVTVAPEVPVPTQGSPSEPSQAQPPVAGKPPTSTAPTAAKPAPTATGTNTAATPAPAATATGTAATPAPTATATGTAATPQEAPASTDAPAQPKPEETVKVPSQACVTECATKLQSCVSSADGGMLDLSKGAACKTAFDQCIAAC
jgi:hypothetical protein